MTGVQTCALPIFVIAQGAEAGGHRGTYLRNPYESMTGTFALTRLIARAVKIPVVAAGGITTLDEVRALDRMGASCQLGMAIYTGKLALSDCLVGLGDWDKVGGLVPVVAQDTTGQILQCAHATPEALRQTLETGRATYWSRSRNALWRKGDTSGHAQQVKTVRWDCDRDALLYVVEQTGRACHLPQYSCFGDRAFSLGALEQVLQERLRHPEPGSYTARLFADPDLLHAKLMEEAAELVAAPSPRDSVWEAADVLYFAMAVVAQRGLTLDQVVRELRGRQGRRRTAS